MARYEDYVKETSPATETIETEITVAGEAQAERSVQTVPDSVAKRFEGKSIDDVLNSYAHLENKLSEQGQTMGNLRNSFDEYVLLQSQTSEPEPVQEPVTADDLYDNPNDAIAKVVKSETSDKLTEIENELKAVRRERALAEFERKHPDAREQAKTPEFVEWMNGSPYRQRLAGHADSFDLEAAEELFGLYEDSTSIQSSAVSNAKREADLRNASLESSSPETPGMEETYSRAEIIDVKLRAKLGDASAKVWLTKHAEELAIAYEEGRVVD